jgi:hypothetical protein
MEQDLPEAPHGFKPQAALGLADAIRAEDKVPGFDDIGLFLLV